MARTITDEDADAIAQRVVKLLVERNKVAHIEPNALYSVPAAARLVVMHPDTLREKLRDGIVKGRRKNGGFWRILGSELLKLA